MNSNFRKTIPVVKIPSKKMWLFSTTRIIPYLLLILVLAGGVGYFSKTQAQTPAPADPNQMGRCAWTNSRGDPMEDQRKRGECTSGNIPGSSTVRFLTPGTIGNAIEGGGEKVADKPPDDTGIGNNLPDCIFPIPNIAGCLVKISYFLLNVLPSFLLTYSAMFFNAIVALTLSGKMISGSTFIPTAWAVVRDLSNIFFILILLYVGIQTILGISDHAKKMVVQVIIMALLINFSMFFTKIVIDTSNVLALIFYNKINTETTVDGVKKAYLPATNTGTEKDISGGMVNAFNPGKLLSNEFFENAKKRTDTIAEATTAGVLASAGTGAAAGAAAGSPFAGIGAVPGAVIGAVGGLVYYFIPSKEVPIALLFGMIVISGAIMLFATYAFFIAGISFLGRLIELWLLIIFSPFAFMSLSLPKLAGIEYVGWDSWLKRLIEVSFMAPIFMFFLYFIFRLINANIFSGLMRNPAEASTMETVLFIIIPALFILILLMKATDFAKKGGGKFAEVAMGAMKAVGVVGGLALGGASLLAAAGMRKGIGSTVAGFSRSTEALKYGKEYRTASGNFSKDLNSWKSTPRAGRGAKPKLETYTSTITAPTNLKDRIGGRINAAQLKREETAHATTEWDELKKKVGAEGVSNDRLSGMQDSKMLETFAKENRPQIEKDVKRGSDEKGRVLIDPRTGIPMETESQFRTNKRTAVETSVRAMPGMVDPITLDLTKQGESIVLETLNDKWNERLRQLSEVIAKNRFGHIANEAKEKVGIRERVTAASTGGNYDIRNIAELVAKTNSKTLAKVATMMTAGLAIGLRAGFKQLNVNYGKGEGNALKDIGSLITESLKGVKINVDLSSATEVKKDTSHGGGGAHH